MSTDRIKTATLRLIKSSAPAIDFLAFYHAKVVVQSADLTTVDILPDDPRFGAGGLSAIPIRWGMPGCLAQIAPGTSVMLGWDGGDPSKPFVDGWDSGGTLIGFQIGGTAAQQALVLGTAYRAAQLTMHTALIAAFTQASTDPILLGLCTQTATAMGNALAAITAFEALSTTYLSLVSKTV